MLIKNIILILIGVSGGAAVSAGVFAFISMIGVINRLASRTNTAKYILLYEDSVIFGGTLGNLISIFHWKLPIGLFGLILSGLSAGIFVGCLAMALAETLKVIPIFARRVKLTIGMPFVVLSIAAGKFFATIMQLYYFK